MLYHKLMPLAYDKNELFNYWNLHHGDIGY
jgi:hypothetical protein